MGKYLKQISMLWALKGENIPIGELYQRDPYYANTKQILKALYGIHKNVDLVGKNIDPSLSTEPAQYFCPPGIFFFAFPILRPSIFALLITITFQIKTFNKAKYINGMRLHGY